MSVTSNPLMRMRTTESISIDGVGTQRFSYSEFDRTGSPLTSATTPAVSLVGSDKLSLSGGAATIDLTAIPGKVSGQTISFNGVKVVTAMFLNPSTNTGSMTIAKGASNGYSLQSTHSIVLGVGAQCMFYFDDTLSDVSGTAKNLDVTGTGTEVLHYVLVAG